MANPPRIRNYQDLRYKFIRGLIKHEHQQRRHQFLKQAAEWTSKAIVSLSIASEPIRSSKQATQLEGVGPTIRARLDKIQKENTVNNDSPIKGQHVSTGSGLLVALLNESEAIGSSEGGKPLVTESDLKEACSLVCEEKFNVAKPSAYGAPVLCPAWWRINVLISRGFVKKRTRGKKAVFELLTEGEEVARRLRGNHPPPVRIRSHSPTAPTTPTNTPTQSNKKPTSSKRKPQASNCASSSSSTSTISTNYNAGPLYSYDNGNDGVVLLVDDHELGGDRMRLGELSRRLKHWNVQHKTTHLPCGDYLWLWRHREEEVTLPVLVERKRADDLAESIKDGRFVSQKDRMKQWRKDFGMLSDEVCLHYIVESTPEAYCVRCLDGCGGVGKCGNPTVEQLEVVIMELERSRDFNLVRTENIETTVEFLASVTVELQQRVTNGDFEALRLMKQGGYTPTSNRSTSSTYTSTNKSSSLVTKTTNFTPHNHLNLTPSTSKTDYADNKPYSSSSVSKATHSTPQSHLNSPTRRTTEQSYSPSRLGTKRRFVGIDQDDVIDRKPVKCKAEFIDLCDSQDDDVIIQSSFDNNKAAFSNHYNSNIQHYDRQFQTSQSTNHNAQTRINQDTKANGMPIFDVIQDFNQKSRATNQNADNQDEEAKIVSVREVIPDASLDDVLSALSSCAGKVDLAVEKLLDRFTS